MTQEEISRLQQFASLVRVHILRQIRHAGSGHLAGSLDMADVFTYFYQQVLNHRPTEPQWSDRDLFFLSAGHICPVWYATLALYGYFPPEKLLTLRQFGSQLQGHPQRQPELGLENSSGPLGQGVSMAVGAAHALKQAKSARRVFVVSSDGEQQEGQIWESYLFASHHQLSNFTILIDCNGIQQSGHVSDILNLEDLAAKFKAFNFAVAKVDAHDFTALDKAWQKLSAVTDKPHALLCHTVPGKGIPLLENDYHWHAGQPDDKQWSEIFAQAAQLLSSTGATWPPAGESS